MILLLISFLLDGIVSNYFPYSINSLTWFQPCFFVVFVVYLYFYYLNKKNFLIEGIIYTIIGSLLFGNSILLRVSSFLLIYIFLKFITRKWNFSIKLLLFSLVVSLFIYFYSTYLISFVFGKITLSVIIVLWQYLHYLLFNSFFILIIYYFFGINTKTR